MLLARKTPSKIRKGFPTLPRVWEARGSILVKRRTNMNNQEIINRINYLTSLPELTREQEEELFDLYSDCEVETY